MKHDTIYGPNGLKIVNAPNGPEVRKGDFSASYAKACEACILTNGDDIELPLSRKEASWLLEQQGKAK